MSRSAAGWRIHQRQPQEQQPVDPFSLKVRALGVVGHQGESLLCRRRECQEQGVPTTRRRVGPHRVAVFLTSLHHESGLEGARWRLAGQHPSCAHDAQRGLLPAHLREVVLRDVLRGLELGPFLPLALHRLEHADLVLGRELAELDLVVAGLAGEVDLAKAHRRLRHVARAQVGRVQGDRVSLSHAAARLPELRR